MSVAVPQEILDALTRVDMPRVPKPSLESDNLHLAGVNLPIYRCGALVVGSGAAGLRAAVELERHGEDVLVISTSPFGGTSACSGSDKQTLHTAGTSNRGDDFGRLAKDIGSGGCMDADTAYIESVGSLAAFNGLQYIGLPLPQDRFGAVLRYQTDHDEVGRATSCGPRTSRLMVKVLAEEAIRLDIPLLGKCEAVRLLVDGEGDRARVAGVVAIDHNRRDDEAHGLSVFLAHSIVLATGGPGELYRDSVYPKHCYGSLGMAIEAGLEVTNLTESQFGIGTRRTEFPWNLSGTYVQVLPYIYSVDDAGKEYNFLADYYRTTQELVSNVFRKGYQWPFHATRMLDFGSSLVDLAIFRESRKGRTILMDFLRNPATVPGDAAFSLERLDDDVRAYLENNAALQELPIERLQMMNPLAIELYKMHGTDLTKEPLPFNVSNQHMNGGVNVDIWNQSSLTGCYAVGEVAGTHGVTRPGGAALNGGQVGGIRCARHIHEQHRSPPLPELSDAVQAQVADTIGLAQEALANDQGLSIEATRDAIQTRMSDHAGFICVKDEVGPALRDAAELRQRVFTTGLRCERPTRIADVYRWRHLALTAEAVLTALEHFITQGGGSRGARALIDPSGEDQPATSREELGSDFRILRERDEHKDHKLVLSFQGEDAAEAFSIDERPLRTIEDLSKIFFEKNWAPFLTGTIYGDGYRHDA